MGKLIRLGWLATAYYFRSHGRARSPHGVADHRHFTASQRNGILGNHRCQYWQPVLPLRQSEPPPATIRASSPVNGETGVAVRRETIVHIDGRTVTNLAAGIHYPDKSYYPYVGKAWEAVTGVTNNLAGGTGTIFLPLIVQGTLQPVSMTQDTTIAFPPSVVASNPALAGGSITVPAELVVCG